MLQFFDVVFWCPACFRVWAHEVIANNNCTTASRAMRLFCVMKSHKVQQIESQQGQPGKQGLGVMRTVQLRPNEETISSCGNFGIPSKISLRHLPWSYKEIERQITRFMHRRCKIGHVSICFYSLFLLLQQINERRCLKVRNVVCTPQKFTLIICLKDLLNIKMFCLI